MTALFDYIVFETNINITTNIKELHITVQETLTATLDMFQSGIQKSYDKLEESRANGRQYLKK